jgi:hypothetical protein
MAIIMRKNSTHLIATLICVIIAAMSCPSAASDDYTNLMKLITENEDVQINAQDLAFLLATHNFDATPKDDYVIVKLDIGVYKLVPNGMKPGLADVIILD